MSAKRKAPVIQLQQPQPEALQLLTANVEKLHELGVESIAEARILCAAIEPGATLATIAKKLRIPTSTASRTIFALSERGLVTYTNHATDRRKKIIGAKLERLA